MTLFLPKARWRPPALCLIALVAAPTLAEDTWQLETLTVGAEAPVTASPTASVSQQQIERTPGGASLISNEQIRDGRSADLADALAGTPGVFARSRFGQDEVRLSIRGSGISQNFNTRGVRLLRDGLPVTEADGNTRSQLIDPLSADHIAVYRGANAMGQGAATLGGAINLVSPTGYSENNRTLRADGGSFGQRRGQIAGGGHNQQGLDGFASFTASEQDGFRDQSAQSVQRFYGNLGLAHNGGHETRLHIDAQRSRLELPGPLTPQEYRQDANQAQPENEAVDAARDLDVGRLALFHARDLGPGNQLQLGVFYQDLQMDHPLGFATITSNQQDAGVSLRQVLQGSLAGRDSRFTWGLLAVAGQDDNRQDFNFPRPDLERDFFATTGEVFVDNQWQFNQSNTLVLSAQALAARREVTENDQTRHRTYQGLSPRIGVLHQLSEPMQLFANLSRALEPPVNGELVSEDDRLLRAQRAHTLELGGRGNFATTQWELAVYRAHLQREILIFGEPGEPDTRNANRTVHQGLEAAISHQRPLAENYLLNTRASYTWNDFRFKDDPQWGNNRLPGIPEHQLRLAPRLIHSSGFYAGPLVDYNNSTQTDFANSTAAGTVVLLGARAGYDSPRGWSAFLDARNLADRRHVASVNVQADAREDQRVFNPGPGRALFGGVQWQW
ncbi:MAG: TonB-dependent receptor [Halomonadaceae bacterium]|nr:MAG: TonB-dependent receptor [Halomonadaceae bacterium]